MQGLFAAIRNSLWLAVLLLGLGASCEASEQARQFLAGLEAYQAEDYEKAIQDFETIAQSGVTNGRLFYNLGNAYLKNDQLGPAILWYERARKLIPDDPDLRFNLEHAHSLTKDAVDSDGSPLVRIFFFWRYQLSPRSIRIAAIVCNGIFWVLLGAWLLMRRKGLSRAAKVVALPALVFVITAIFNYHEAANLQRAIVLPEQTAVRSGLTDDATQLFVLHAGAKVSIVKARNDHFQIRFAADKIGWVGKNAVGVI